MKKNIIVFLLSLLVGFPIFTMQEEDNEKVDRKAFLDVLEKIGKDFSKKGKYERKYNILKGLNNKDSIPRIKSWVCNLSGEKISLEGIPCVLSNLNKLLQEQKENGTSKQKKEPEYIDHKDLASTIQNADQGELLSKDATTQHDFNTGTVVINDVSSLLREQDPHTQDEFDTGTTVIHNASEVLKKGSVSDKEPDNTNKDEEIDKPVTPFEKVSGPPNRRPFSRKKFKRPQVSSIYPSSINNPVKNGNNNSKKESVYIPDWLPIKPASFLGAIALTATIFKLTWDHVTLAREVTRNEHALRGLLKTLSELENNHISKEQLLSLYDSVANNLTLITESEKENIRVQLHETPLKVKEYLLSMLSALPQRAQVHRATRSAMQRVRRGFSQDCENIKKWVFKLVGLKK